MNKWLIGSFLVLALACEQEKQEIRLIDYVDPFIGTDGKGKTYPGATVPFGKIQLSPDNGRNGWDWISGYFYPDSVIAGFSHLHLTGTGAGDLYDISFMPTSGELKEAKLDDVANSPTVYSGFSHDREQASPGYYQVYLEDYQVNVELTATNRTGLQKYTFEGQENRVRLNLGYTRNWDKVIDSSIKVLNDSTIIGHRFSDGWAKNQRVYFVSIFSEPIQSYDFFKESKSQPSDKMRGTDLLAIFDFGEAKELLIKTSISSTGQQQAFENLMAEQPSFDFEQVRGKAELKWEVGLGKVRIEASEDNKIQFYTAMYHSMLAPTLWSDVGGGYMGPDRKPHMASGFKKYSTFSLWDTYRAQHPWLTITKPEIVPDMLKSMLSFYDEYGKLPVWNMQGSETDMMIGYHAVPVLTDAIFKGFEIDTLKAFEAMKASALQDNFGLANYRRLGYVPYEDKGWNVSLTMEYAYDDWCIAQVARLLEEDADYEHFLKRSANYLNHFDAETGFFRARSAGGMFKEDFDPLAYHPSDYCEANAWQYYWYVPQDVPKLIELTGGKEKFVQKLDEMFETEQSEGEDPEWISGYFGQYVHGNEPSHHVPYLYQYADAPSKTQYWARKIMDEMYTTEPDGLVGNEDCGQMSAWYLFSALGFYPVNPANGKYILGSPEVHEATIHLSEQMTFRIVAINQSKENVYVKSVKLNDQTIDDFFITHEQLLAGGELVFEMSDEPYNK